MKKTPPSQIKLMRLSDLKKAPYNPRTIEAAALGGLKESIKRFGLVQPIVWNKRTKRIVAGHQRVMAMREMGMKEAQVIVVDWPELTEKEANIALNNRAIEGDFTPEILRLLNEIEAQDKAMFDALLLGDIPTNFPLDNSVVGDHDDDLPEKPAEPVTKLGDVWKMGDHQLLCGDATSPTDVLYIIGQRKANLVFTDPPYNVDYEGYTDKNLKIENDKMTSDQFIEFLKKSFESYRSIIEKNGSLYVCHPSSYQREFQNAMEAAGFVIRCQIIWAKNNFAWGFGRYKFQHEPIFYAHVGGVEDEWYGDKTQSTLWAEKKPAANRLHPTMKPVELVVRAIQNSSRPGDIVVDFFGGGGSTLIAAERTGRICRMIELDPKYCDVIVKRWEGITGKKATRT